MQKPLIVCGMDFSGTSMVAGMLHAAGIDMGDVESAEDVAQSDRPIRYRMFEDRAFHKDFYWYAENIMEEPSTAHSEVLSLSGHFLEYMAYREASAKGKRWGVKSNILTFLTLYDKWKELPVEWITTYRPLADSMASAFDKLGMYPQIAAFLGAQWLAYIKLRPAMCLRYSDLLRAPAEPTWNLKKFAGLHEASVYDMASIIDPIHKGVIPWQPSGLLSQA